MEQVTIATIASRPRSSTSSEEDMVVSLCPNVSIKYLLSVQKIVSGSIPTTSNLGRKRRNRREEKRYKELEVRKEEREREVLSQRKERKKKKKKTPPKKDQKNSQNQHQTYPPVFIRGCVAIAAACALVTPRVWLHHGEIPSPAFDSACPIGRK